MPKNPASDAKANADDISQHARLPAPLSMTAANGAQWSFDPASGKWTVQMGDQKANSLKKETLQERVSKWESAAAKAKAKTTPPPEPPVSVQFGIARMFPNVDSHHLDWGSLLGASIADNPRNAKGYSVKAAWSATRADVAIERYQADTKDASWESRNADNLDLIRFDALDSDQQDWWASLMNARAQTFAATAARESILKMWRALKSDETRFFELGSAREGSIRPLSREQLSQTSYSWALPAGCPLSVSTTLQDAAGWEPTGGAWKKNQVVLSMEASQWGSPSFKVSTQEGDELSVQSDFLPALTLANATVAAAAMPTRQYWRLSVRNNVRKPGSFPMLVSIASAVFEALDSPRDSKLWSLGAAQSDSVSEFFARDAKSLPPPSAMPKLEWDQDSRVDRDVSFVPVGPEDAVLAELRSLDQALLDATATLREESRDAMRARLAEQSRLSVKTAYDLMIEGAELASDPAHAVAQWSTTLDRLAQSAARHPEVVAFIAHCEAAVEQARAALAPFTPPQSPTPALAAATRKPRP